MKTNEIKFNDYSNGVNENQMKEILLFDLFFKSFNSKSETIEKVRWYLEEFCKSCDSEIEFSEHLKNEHFRQLDYIEMLKQ